jgi:membrane protein
MLGRLLEREMRVATLLGAWVARLWTRIWQDDILFLASGLAFNVLVCLLPVMLIWMYVLGMWLRTEETIHLAHRVIMAAFPNQPFTDAIRDGFSSVLQEMLLHKKSLGFISILVLVCTSASLFSSTRSALHRVFSVRPSRHLLLSYLLDITLVLALTLLILGATTLVWVIRAVKRLQILFPAADHTALGAWSGMVTDLSSIPILFLLCYVLYRYVPDQRPSKRKAFWAALATSLIWEVSGRVFALYLGSLTSYSRIYGAYAFVLVLMVWVFYSCFIFVLGAEAAQAAQEVRTESRNRKYLSS